MVDKAKENTRGRALEYLLVETWRDALGATLTAEAERYQSRDQSKVGLIPAELYSAFVEAGTLSSDWFSNVVGSGEIELDRMSDISGGVGDIRIITNSNAIDVSVKHNHNATKHPRPYSIAQWCGIQKGSQDDLDARGELLRLTDEFRIVNHGKKLFEDVDPRINLDFFTKITCECANIINGWENSSEIASPLFDFLVGSGFYKMIIKTRPRDHSLNSLEIYDYSNIQVPQHVSAVTHQSVGAAYLMLNFDNSWQLDLRLHSASKGIETRPGKQVALKFDSQIQTSTLGAPLVIYLKN